MESRIKMSETNESQNAKMNKGKNQNAKDDVKALMSVKAIPIETGISRNYATANVSAERGSPTDVTPPTHLTRDNEAVSQNPLLVNG